MNLDKYLQLGGEAKAFGLQGVGPYILHQECVGTVSGSVCPGPAPLPEFTIVSSLCCRVKAVSPSLIHWCLKRMTKMKRRRSLNWSCWHLGGTAGPGSPLGCSSPL